MFCFVCREKNAGAKTEGSVAKSKLCIWRMGVVVVVVVERVIIPEWRQIDGGQRWNNRGGKIKGSEKR